ncbi:polysaccharide pyruvyl transferase family protein [Pseudothermotoga thermarum]|uniref:Polysaccharide pyruvyl transferase n=1 Tax=Pseudothermotoga thermarum DSM 5069 TaxID=688269 RepID=F7YW75_9THEM|nr:polysaccharide pyruvyl transferase family protein [Pseudothermotoga thermarum]AEH51847.1 polysaccharide pyruvyl transferase [Pseudothermotoga thermarum DSM 5069]
MKTAFVFGYYGYGNVGDELLCKATLKLLEEAGFHKIYLAVPKERVNDYTSKLVKPVDRFSPFAVIKAITKSSVVVCGGGGIFQDETSFRSLLYYSSIVFLSILLRKPVILLGNSFGPLKRKSSRFLVKSFLASRKVYVFARDPVSYRYARMVGKNVYQGTDLAVLAFDFDPDFQSSSNWICFCVKKPMDLSHLVNVIEEKVGKENVVITAFSEEDEEVSLQIASKHNLKYVEDPIKAVLSSRLVVSQRMHASLLAAYYGIPFISLNNSKANRFMKKYLPKYEGYLKEDEVEVALAVVKLLDKKIDVAKQMMNDAKDMAERFKKLLKVLCK